MRFLTIFLLAVAITAISASSKSKTTALLKIIEPTLKGEVEPAATGVGKGVNSAIKEVNSALNYAQSAAKEAVSAAKAVASKTLAGAADAVENVPKVVSQTIKALGSNPVTTVVQALL
uniref:Silk-associated protein n=1 Tax=Arachnocampa richardsae TaxID=270896 RepID=S4THT6_9DIPT|nr:silk-associated protein [Arachnocampa richardsae]